MAESKELLQARDHLARAEKAYRSADGLHDLEDGLALLEDVIVGGDTADTEIANNLLATYCEKICDSIRQLVESDPTLPEPDLEQLFKTLLAFDAVDLELPEFVRPLKIQVVKRLIDLHYEGYPEAEKQRMLETLAGIAAE